jgi:hypothetical protein
MIICFLGCEWLPGVKSIIGAPCRINAEPIGGCLLMLQGGTDAGLEYS